VRKALEASLARVEKQQRYNNFLSDSGSGINKIHHTMQLPTLREILPEHFRDVLAPVNGNGESDPLPGGETVFQVVGNRDISERERKFEVNYKLRCKIHALREEAGWPYTRIADTYNLPLTTVYRICKSRETPQKRKSCGRRKKIDTPTRKALVARSKMDATHRRMTFARVASELGLRADEKTLRRAFAKEGIYRRIGRKKPYLDLTKKFKRLKYAHTHRDWTISDWRHVIWTDECYVWLSGYTGRVYVTRAAGEELFDDCLVPTYAKRSSVMVWGGILGLNGKKVLVLWERDDWGTIRATTYIDHVLVPVIWPFWYWESLYAGTTLWLMEDGAKPHQAGITKRVKEDARIPTLEWPPSSPDLNPIENIWSILKTNLNKRTLRPHSTAELKQAILEEWDNISVEVIQKHVDSVPERIEAVIAAGGGHTKW
jgi:hypothetical protein